MEAWGNEEVWYDSDIAKYKMELWLSLEQYEQVIQDEAKGYEIAYEMLEQKYANHVAQIKRSTCLQISALEAALVDTKMQKDLEIERLNFALCALESNVLNTVIEPRHAEDLVKRCEKGVVLSNLKEARLIILEFLRILRSKESEIANLRKAKLKTEKENDTTGERIKDREAFYLEERRLRQYYQTIVLKLARDLSLFESDPARQEKFGMIYEKENDLNYQRQIFAVLEHIDLQGAIVGHTNAHFG